MREQHGFTTPQHGLTNENPQPFGNYDLLRRIDVGGMGEVYLARQRTAFGREVAVKIIRTDLVHDITARKRFLREAEVSAYLKHDHILPLFEFGEEQGRLFLVTPYIKGGTLSTRLQLGSISISDIQQLFTALVQAVSYLHKRGVVHRDLKPSNILLDHEEDSDRVYVRLIDFGIASLQGHAASAPLTTSGTEMGTVAYMAPERLEGIAAPSNDIYSLGVILYQMLTGQIPEAEKMVSLPPPLEHVVRRCIEPNPYDRFASAEDLLKTFEYAYKSLTSPRLPMITPPVITEADVVPQYSMPQQPERDNSEEDMFVSGEHTRSLPPPLPRAEWKLPPLPNNEHFSGDDYNAPTNYIDPAILHMQHTVDEPVSIQKPPRVRKRRMRSLVVITSLLIVALLMAIGGLGFLLVQSSITANITVSPNVQTISTVFTLTAKPGLTSSTGNDTSIRADVLTSTQTGTQQGATTGKANCTLIGLFNCQQAVSTDDARLLVEQMRPGVQTKVNQDLQKQASTKGATLVGKIAYTDVNAVPNPAINTVSKTVSVTLTEKGSVEYVRTQDAHDRALTLLRNKLPPNYAFVDALTQISTPEIQNIDNNGVVTIAVAAGGVARYQIPDSELTDIQNHIKGMSEQEAKTFIAKQAHLDPTTIRIHISYGNTIPTNTQQIKLITEDPTNLPPVRLTPVPTPAATPSN